MKRGWPLREGFPRSAVSISVGEGVIRASSIPARAISVKTGPKSSIRPRRNAAVLLSATGLVVGLFAVAQWPARTAGMTSPLSRHASSLETVRQLEAEQTALKKEIATLRGGTTDSAAPATDASLADVELALQSERAAAGVLPLRGSAIDILLDDSTTRKLLPSENPDNYIVHEYQIRDVVNLLWAAGARGIAVNDERFVNSTSVYCVGSTILINDTRTSPPYHIVAVGDPQRLQAALDDGRSLIELKDRVQVYGLVFKVTQVGEFTLPSFDGSIALRFARPVDSTVALDSASPPGR